jgi:arabinan endo-1,5-alpha-L-arabinosidase
VGIVRSHLDAVSSTALLGFEDAALWHGPGSLTLSPVHTQGQSSLAVTPAGYSLYQSEAFSFSGRAKTIALDLELPTTQPNPYWLGAVQLYLEAPSRNLYNAYIGQVELTGRPLGAFTTLEYAVPTWVSAALADGCDDLKIKIALNVPGSPGVYLLDNLRIRTDLLVHYQFDAPATDGKVIDSSGYDRTATLRGAAALTSDGRIDSALKLDGAGSYLELPDGLTDGVKDITVAAWVNLAGNGAWSRIFDFGGASGFMYLTPFSNDGIRFSTFAGLGVEGTVTAPTLPLGAWKHIAVTSSGRDYRVYVDGVEVSNALTVPVAPADIGANVGNWIGRSRFPDPFLAGKVDDFRIYDRVLKQSEIANLAAPKRDYSSYRFDELTGTTVKDSSALALDGTLFGSASHAPGVINGSLVLPGGGSHVQLPAGIVQSCTDLTISAWVKLHSNAPWNRVFDFGKPDFSSFMYLSPAGFGPFGQELRFGLITPRGIHDVGFPYVLPLSEWTHLAVVLRDDTASLFLNGRVVTRQGGVISNPSDMGTTIGNYFGRSTFPGDPSFDGAMDDFRISCRAYDDGEIQQLAHMPAPVALPNHIEVTGDTTFVHDPSIIQAEGRYHIFSTGAGLLTRSSADLKKWTLGSSVFAQNPPWVLEKFGNLDSLWAPDISFFGGTYHLYYAASTFGSNHSCIGHATKANLTSATAWVDHGPVLCSNDGGSVDDFNAIDPNVALDANGVPWLSFGSFWSGLKIARLDNLGNRADSVITSIASRPETAIEAPYIVYRAPYYYLFASFDFCCQGANSNYRVVVGRSTQITGPYFDRTGLNMLAGGGTPVVSRDSRWAGPGHNAVLRRSNGDMLNVYHSYDVLNSGIPTLRISELTWQEGWPISGEP